MLPQTEVSAERGILLSDIADDFAVACRVPEHSLLHSSVRVSLHAYIPASDLHTALAVGELQQQAISCFSKTNHILVFENVPWTLSVNVASLFKML